MIDTNVYLSRWPFRRLPLDETPKLVERLRAAGVEQAWAGSFEALLHRDVAGVNARLAEECRAAGDGLLLPFGTVNVTLPEWQDDLRRCHETHGMHGLRLHPNYHGYALDDPRFEELAGMAAERSLLVQIALTMEDERTQHPLARVPHVDVRKLPALVDRLPSLNVQLLNAFRSLRTERMDDLASRDRVHFEIASLEGVAGVERLVEVVTARRVLFGSHAPFFYLESAVLKLKESNLGGLQTQEIATGNARRLLESLRA